MSIHDNMTRALQLAARAIADDPELLTCNMADAHRCMDSDQCIRVEIRAYQGGYFEICTSSKWSGMIEER